MSETATNAADAAPNSTSNTFSADYVKELRAENKATRLRTQELETQLAHAAESGKKLELDFSNKEKAISEQAKQAAIRSEMKVHALKAGMVDLDGLKLLDLSKIQLNEAGELENADAVLKQAKDSKPWLFNITTSTSSTASPPKASEVKTKSALEMSADELAAFEKQHGIKSRF